MVTQTLTPMTDKITYQENTYLIPRKALEEAFEVLGKASKPCEFGACGHIELIPKHKWSNKEFWQECIYESKDLEWEVAVSEKEGFSSKIERCVAIDDKLIEYLEAGIFNDYIQQN